MMKDKKPERKRKTVISFLRELYTKDPLVSNEMALHLVRAAFPESNANNRTIIVWKKKLRDEGFEIPCFYTKSKRAFNGRK